MTTVQITPRQFTATAAAHTAVWSDWHETAFARAALLPHGGGRFSTADDDALIELSAARGFNNRFEE